MLAHHLLSNISRVKIAHLAQARSNNERCTHCCTSPKRQPHCTTHTTPKWVTSILCTRFSTQRSTRSYASQPRSYRLPKATLSSAANIAVLAHYTHIRLRLPGGQHLTWHHTGTEQYSTLSDPSIEAPTMGTSHGIFLYRSCAFVITTSHTSTIQRVVYIYNICAIPQSSYSQIW